MNLILFRIALIILGVYNNIDGWYSIYRYWNSNGPNGKQGGLTLDNLVRIIRAGFGIFVIILALLI